MSRQPPVQQPPPVQRLRVRYAKRGRARFASHRDFSRAFERALRRAGIPMAFSSGFSPHPRISYVNAAPTGAASEAEYLEIALAAPMTPPDVASRLDAALPDGFAIVAVAEAAGPHLPELLTHSRWSIELRGVSQAALEAGVAAFLAADAIDVQRLTKNGIRTFDVRAPVVGFTIVAPERLEIVSALGVPLVRPDDVVQGLMRVAPTVMPSQPAVFTRLAQGCLDGEQVVDPF